MIDRRQVQAALRLLVQRLADALQAHGLQARCLALRIETEHGEPVDAVKTLEAPASGIVALAPLMDTLLAACTPASGVTGVTLLAAECRPTRAEQISLLPADPAPMPVDDLLRDLAVRFGASTVSRAVPAEPAARLPNEQIRLETWGDY